jgi:chemotaxis signal transduction protein
VTAATSELLLFQLGPRMFAAEVADVVRIGNPLDAPAAALVTVTALGEPYSPSRAIVVGCGDGEERALVVDQVLGVRTIPQRDLHPLPAFAACCLRSSALAGVVLVDEAPTLLVDLSTLIREQRRDCGAGAPPGSDHV